MFNNFTTRWIVKTLNNDRWKYSENLITLFLRELYCNKQSNFTKKKIWASVEICATQVRSTYSPPPNHPTPTPISANIAAQLFSGLKLFFGLKIVFSWISSLVWTIINFNKENFIIYVVLNKKFYLSDCICITYYRYVSKNKTDYKYE